jgi:WD40 repeat protein
VHNGCFLALWDVQKEKLIAETKECKVEGEQVNCLAFSLDNKVLAAGDRNGKIWIVDGQTGELKAKLDAYSGLVSQIALSPDSKTLVSASYKENTVKLWDVQAGKLRRALEGNKGSAHVVAFSPSGELFATAGSVSQNGKWVIEVILWDAQTGELNRVLPDAPTMSVSSLAFSPDGKTLAIGSGDLVDGKTGRTAGELKLWKVESRLTK